MWEKKFENMTEQREVPEVESTEEEQAYQFDSASLEEDDLLQASTNIATVDGPSSRFG